VVTAQHLERRQRFEEIYFDGVDDMLADARSRLHRVSPRMAYQELVHQRAILVDIRPAHQRLAEGEVPVTLRPLIVERNVLEWRFDPSSKARLPQASYDARVIVLCQEGYTSSLAADALHRLGVHRATDVVGGYDAWRRDGMPIVAGRRRGPAPSAPISREKS